MRQIIVFLIAVAMFAAGCFSDATDTTAARSSTTTVAEVTATLPSTTVAPMKTTTTISVPSPAPPVTMTSGILPASNGPLEWRWDPQLGATSEVTSAQEVVKGTACYGIGGEQESSASVDFKGNHLLFTLGHRTAPDIVITDEEGTVTEVGNPFGADAWLCSVAASNTHLLAVGSGVWWSEDSNTWNTIEAFEGLGSSNVDGSDLMWAAGGPSGYLVLGRQGAVWFSEDLQTWYKNSLDEGSGASVWGWVGPTGIGVGEEIVIVMFEEGWIGTRRD